MKQGIIRRIGNGQTTNIWIDNWIPKEHTPRPITSLVQNPPTTVAEMLQPATRSWNEGLVQSVFIRLDADAILRIPVCTRNIDDVWAWYPDKKGRFTVSSAYRFLVSTKLQRRVARGQNEVIFGTGGTKGLVGSMENFNTFKDQSFHVEISTSFAAYHGCAASQK